MYVEVINLNIHSLSFRNTSLHLYDSLIMKSLHSHDYIYTVIFSKIHLRPVFPWPVVCRTSIHPSMFVIFIDTKLSVFKHQTFGDVKRIFPSQNVSGPQKQNLYSNGITTVFHHWYQSMCYTGWKRTNTCVCHVLLVRNSSFKAGEKNFSLSCIIILHH